MQQVGNDLRIMPERAAPTTNREPDRVISATPRPAAPASKPTRNQLAARPARPAAPDWLNEIRLQPVFSDGLQRGYRAYPGGTRVEFTRLGLDVGDLVISVNGRTLDDAAHGQAFYEALTAQSIVVRLERAGRNEYLRLANHYSAP